LAPWLYRHARWHSRCFLRKETLFGQASFRQLHSRPRILVRSASWQRVAIFSFLEAHRAVSLPASLESTHVGEILSNCALECTRRDASLTCGRRLRPSPSVRRPCVRGRSGQEFPKSCQLLCASHHHFASIRFLMRHALRVNREHGQCVIVANLPPNFQGTFRSQLDQPQPDKP